ncbi:unnamed protein product [Musa textilis]
MNDANSSFMDKMSDVPSSNVVHGTSDAPNAFAQALQEKVAALLLLSQQEERHLLEGDLNKALEKKLEELQRNLSQVTNEKVKALMELAELKRDYQLLNENRLHGIKHGSHMVDPGKSTTVQEQEGKLKNILKRTYLRHWMVHDQSQQDTNFLKSTEENSPTNKADSSINIARLKVENAALRESIANLEHLTSSIRRLHILLLKVQDEASSVGTKEGATQAVRNIVTEANQVKTALGGSLPVSWSGDEADAFIYTSLHEPSDPEKLDAVSAAGLEMVDLLILAARLLRQESLVERCVDPQNYFLHPGCRFESTSDMLGSVSDSSIPSSGLSDPDLLPVTVSFMGCNHFVVEENRSYYADARAEDSYGFPVEVLGTEGTSPPDRLMSEIYRYFANRTSPGSDKALRRQRKKERERFGRRRWDTAFR